MGDVYISVTEHNMKLKFSMQTHLTHINTILEYCHASVIIDNADVLYLEDWNGHSLVLKNKTATIFFLKKPFSSFGVFCKPPSTAVGPFYQHC